MPDTELDMTDRKIIGQLFKDSRISYRALARKIKKRPSTVHSRIKKLQDYGVIKRFTIEVDDEKLGRGLTVYMLVSGSLDKYLGKEMQAHKNVREIIGITGEHDLLIKLQFKDIKEFNNYLITFREKYSAGIKQTITMVETIRIK